MGVSWNEYWDFLGCYCDLSQPESLDKLEQYLAQLSEEASLFHPPRIVMSPSLSQPDIGKEVLLESLELDTCRHTTMRDDGCKKTPSSHTQLPAYQLGVSDDIADEHLPENEVSPFPSYLSSPRPPPTSPFSPSTDSLSSSTEVNGNRSESTVVGEVLLNALKNLSVSIGNSQHSVADHTLHTPPNECVTPVKRSSQAVYLMGAEPTKLDHDVLLALCDAEIDAEQYPCVDRWRQLVQSHSNEEQSRWRTPRTHWPTPKLQRVVKPLSPLVHASPPSSSFSPSSPSSFGMTPTGNFPTTPLSRRTGVSATAQSLALSEGRIPPRLQQGQTRTSSGLRVSLFSLSGIPPSTSD